MKLSCTKRLKVGISLMNLPLHKQLLSVIIIFSSFFVLSGCASSASETPLIGWEVNISNHSQDDLNKHHVILLHGMYRTNVAMRPVDRFLKSLGYSTSNISYPSTEYDIETLVKDYLIPEIDKYKEQQNITLHFATHSMGGILVRYYLKHNSLPNLGNVVMIAPPNKGTPLAELFEDSDWINTKSGPSKMQLGASKDSWVNQLGAANFDVGIIAGNENNNILTDMILPGEDDGVVSVESTKLAKMKDFITIPAKHYRLRSNITVLQQVAHFLKYGNFYRLSAKTSKSI